MPGALHAWSGARPLIKDDRVAATDTAHMSRGMAVLDHAARDGLNGMLTIGGGKLTTYRLMAEHIVDAMCEQMGDTERKCRTADEPVPARESQALPGHPSAGGGRRGSLRDPIICECELLRRSVLVKP